MATLSRPLSLDYTPQNRAFISIGVALVTLTFAAILIRLALDAGMTPAAVAALRLTLASAILTPIVIRRYRGQLMALKRRDYLISLFAGVWMGVHFIMMATAFDLTSILVGQVIVNSGPLWVALMEMTFLKARLSRTVWLGLLVAIVGGLIIGLGGFLTTPPSVQTAMVESLPLHEISGAPRSSSVGSLFALIGAIAGSIYMTAGRKARAKISLIPYIWLIYTFGALTALLLALASGTSMFGYPLLSYFWVIVLALIPQLIGHSSLNYALGFFPATVVSIATQAITVTSAIIAFFLFAEVPTALDLFGSAIIISGVSLVILGQRR
ncbi:MAG: DMT family transporter [Anaerolineae bacterium]